MSALLACQNSEIGPSERAIMTLSECAKMSNFDIFEGLGGLKALPDPQNRRFFDDSGFIFAFK
mgnify:CR=1 FL=1